MFLIYTTRFKTIIARIFQSINLKYGGGDCIKPSLPQTLIAYPTLGYGIGTPFSRQNERNGILRMY